MSRQLALGLLLALAFACNKKGGASSDETSPATAATAPAPDASASTAPGQKTADITPASADFLIGKWTSDCVNQPGNLQASVYLQYEFTADGSASAKTISYAGADCTKRFTKADVDAIKTQVNADRSTAGQAPLSPTEIAQYDGLWFPQPSAFQFKLGKKLTDDSIEMNTSQKIADQTVNQFLLVLVQDNQLYFAETCSAAQVTAQICSKVVGDSEKNRARNMRDSIPFHKI